MITIQKQILAGYNPGLEAGIIETQLEIRRLIKRHCERRTGSRLKLKIRSGFEKFASLKALRTRPYIGELDRLNGLHDD